jgi:transposase
MELGHEVIIANPRRIPTISTSNVKSDDNDAEHLARLARADRNLLCPIEHRGRQARMDLANVKGRSCLLKCRKTMVNHARGIVKSFGERITSGKNIAAKARDSLSNELLEVLEPLLQSIEAVDTQIREYDDRVKQLCRKYPETESVRAISGVCPLTALTYVLVLEDPGRFAKSRDVGPYLGLTPRRDQSGDTDKQLHITKAGNSMLRSLLVNCAQFILGPLGLDSELRRRGIAMSEKGGKNGKRRAVVATARRLAVLMHRLWSDRSASYDPFFNSSDKLEQCA